MYNCFPRYLILFEIVLQSLTTWDNGNQLTYPVKYIDPGYKDQNGDSRNKAQEAKSTGFEVIKSDELQLSQITFEKNFEI